MPRHLAYRDDKDADGAGLAGIAGIKDAQKRQARRERKPPRKQTEVFHLRIRLNADKQKTYPHEGGKSMDACRNPLRYFLMAQCIALLILGQTSSFPSARIAYNAQHSIFYYDVSSSLAFCVPNSFENKIQGRPVSDSDGGLCIPLLRTARPVFRHVAAFELPTMRHFWRGTPSPRSPPPCA